MGGAMLFYFSAIPMMPVALVVAGFFTGPVFVLLFQRFSLARRWGPYELPPH